MLTGLPEFIDPIQLAKQHHVLKGNIPLEAMARIHPSLNEIKGDVYFDWLFTMDDQQRPIVNGILQTELPMICQRCLQPMLFSVDATIALMMALAEKEDIPFGYEILVLTSHHPVPLIKLIEDELVLALPIVAKHSTCPHNEYELDDKTSTEAQKYNPFQVLNQLKKH